MKKVLYLIVLTIGIISLTGCGTHFFHFDKDSANADKICKEVATTIGNNDKDGFKELLSDYALEKLKEEDLNHLMSNYKFKIKEFDNPSANISQSDSNKTYEISAACNIKDENNKEYRLIYYYVINDKDEKKEGLNSISFSSKEYDDIHEMQISEDSVIFAPENR